MSYISSMMSKDMRKVLVWERDNKRNRIVRYYDSEYYFYVRDEDGTYEDLSGNKLARLTFPNFTQMRDTRDAFKERDEDVYESDIPMEYKVLSNNYYGKKIKPLNFTLYDIEVDYDPHKGFAGPANPYAPISAVAIYHEYDGRMVVYAVPSPKFKHIRMKDVPKDITDNVELVLCKTEKELLVHLMREIENSDILSGWNSDFYDMPYVYERIVKVFGKARASKLSFDGAKPPYYREVEKFGQTLKKLIPHGRLSIDYLELFKKFEMAERPSYALDAISEEMLPDLPKLSYDGSLHDLYHENFFQFLRYNARDTEILKGFEDKLGYMQLAIDMSHLSGAHISDVLGTIKLAEQAVINYCHYDLGKQVKDSGEYRPPEGKFTGALVLDPQAGMHKMSSSVDLESLYPRTLQSGNMSPDTLVAQFVERQHAHKLISEKSDIILMLEYEDGTVEEMSAKDWRVRLLDNNYFISGYGTVFNMDKQGFIPAILETWFNTRKEYKKRMFDAKNEIERLGKIGGSADKIKKLSEEAKYYDRIQYIQKIKLNSMYGALGNAYFKFFDIRIAESTTRTARGVLMHMVHKTAEILDGEYTWPSPSIIYGDTDSVYFKTNVDTVDEAKEVGKSIEVQVNATFPDFMSESFLCNDTYNNLMRTEQEIVSDCGIFVKKKHYMLHLAYLDGYAVDKMKIMGLPLKKTTVPKPIKIVLTKYMEDLLKGRDWSDISRDLVAYRAELRDSENIMDIGLPKGIKKIEEYTERYQNAEEGLRLPGHVAAGMFWNHCLSHYDDKESITISSGMKIKVFYLKRKFGKFKSIAIPTDTKHLPDWFIRNFEPLVDREAQVLRLVENTIKTILGAIEERMPTAKSLLFDDLVTY